MSIRYVDLTPSELQYLAKRGSASAHEALHERARKGDPESLHYCSKHLAMMGAENPISPLDFLMPHRLIARAVAAKGSPAEAMRQAGLSSPGAMARGMRGRGMPLGGRRRRVGPPPAGTLPAGAAPGTAWGVFVDYSQEPNEVFDTLDAANAWAASIPQGTFFAVIQEGQEPPRPPYGVNQPLTPDTAYQSQQNYGAMPANRPLSTYEQYQQAQGQRF